MSDFIARVKDQGLARTIEKGFEKLNWYRKKGFSPFLKEVVKILPSLLKDYKSPDDEELKIIEGDFLKAGIYIDIYKVEKVSINAFLKKYSFGNDFYGGKDNPVWIEKVLEHFIAWEIVVKDLKKDEHYIDVAASSSPWVKLLNEKGFKATGIDLVESNKFKDDPNYLVMDATKTSFKDGSVSGVSLQCAFEMFTGDDDTNLIKELGRILKQGGKAVIVPLYMHTHYCGYTTKDFRFSKRYHDKGAKLYLRKDCSGIPFSRKYDVATLKERVFDIAEKSGLDYKIHVLRNGKSINEEIYCHFILELVKK